MNKKQCALAALKVTAIYIIFGFMWIFSSDFLLNKIYYEPRLTFFQSIKGIVFVLVTSILFFLILRSELIKQTAISNRLINESNRLFSLMNTLPAFLCLQSTDYSIRYANNSFIEKFGVIKDKKCYEILRNLSEPCPQCKITNVLNKHEPLNWELKGRDGRVYHVYDYPYHDTDGQPLILKLGIDVTESKRAEEALRQSEERYRTLFNSMLEGFALHEIICDDKGKPYDFRFLEVNRGFEINTGLKREDVLGKTVREVLPGIEPHWIDVYGEVALGGEPRNVTNYSEPLDKHFSVHVFSPARGQFATIFMDITETYRSQEALKESESRMAGIVETVPSGITFLNTEGKIIYANAAAEQILRLERNTISQRFYNDPTWRISSVDGTCFSDEELPFMRVMRTRQPVWGVEHAIEHEDGTRVILSINAAPLFDGAGNITGVVASINDITERKEIEQRLMHMATNDYLTGVPNRYYLEENLKKAVDKARNGTRCALLFIDIDNFKIVNDLFGHSTGDQMLIRMAGIIKSNLRQGDLLARVGGDEFAVLLEGVSQREAGAIAERIRSTADEQELIPAKFSNFPILSISVGVVMVDGFYDAEQLLSIADIALHTAKERGRNRVIFKQPGPGTRTQLERTNELFNLIKKAVKEDQLVLHFQPIHKITKGTTRISHFEGLVRIKGTNGELVPPGEFIPVAERFNLMPLVDRWVVNEVLGILDKYRGIRIFVNISGLSLSEADLLLFIERRIKESGIDPARLGFEITETAAIKDFLHAERWIKRLKGIGCKFSIDDFGMGFSSFSYLKNMPVDYLKIDGSFIRNINTDPTHTALVQAMHSIARTLGKKTIAEFIESREVLDMLQELQIDYGQGYLFGRPGPIEEWVGATNKTDRG